MEEETTDGTLRDLISLCMATLVRRSWRKLRGALFSRPVSGSQFEPATPLTWSKPLPALQVQSTFYPRKKKGPVSRMRHAAVRSVADRYWIQHSCSAV